MNFLARTQETQGKLVEGQAHPQRTITTFFHPITPTNATSKSRDTQMGSRLGRNTRATINRAIVICRARRLQSHGPLPLHPCHRQLKAIISPHRKHFPRFETSPFWIDLCQRSFKENCQIIFNLRISHVSKTRFPRLFLSYILLYLQSIIYLFFDLLFSKRRQHLRCNFLFGFTGHFRLLQDVNISYFLSSFLLTPSLSHTHCASTYPNTTRVRFFKWYQSIRVRDPSQSSTIETL